ncbi:hypothetical protein FD977_05120 [Polynucleobacter sp. AP-Elch-400A-B2]|uniref:hypothetical protein n=1 Tax=Polynucleobacter sp. AP-Elch-400A-B2 TaxID=2576930 RepID=UPI001BFEA0EA|nr:hypothetical protein [Polynucleobacter sp. AP-Elch-400A-B2]QWE25620.1 hypothetical protein FD977_05120 [Polynucleobacter sp. AP-Elch-400A-B2]
MSTSTPNSAPAHGFKEKAKEAFIKALQLTIYFGSWFCTLAFLAATSLDERPIPLSIFGFALFKAAICAKFMLIAQAAYPIKVNKQHGIVGSLFLESLFYLLVVLALNYLEAGVHGLIHGKPFLISMTDFGQSNPLRVVAMSIVYWLIVWPYLLLTGMTIMLGGNATLKILFGDKSKLN